MKSRGTNAFLIALTLLTLLCGCGRSHPHKLIDAVYHGEKMVTHELSNILWFEAEVQDITAEDGPLSAMLENVDRVTLHDGRIAIKRVQSGTDDEIDVDGTYYDVNSNRLPVSIVIKPVATGQERVQIGIIAFE